jgi:hypothetical protein
MQGDSLSISIHASLTEVGSVFVTKYNKKRIGEHIVLPLAITLLGRFDSFRNRSVIRMSDLDEQFPNISVRARDPGTGFNDEAAQNSGCLSYCEQRKHCQPSGAVEFVTFRLLI